MKKIITLCLLAFIGTTTLNAQTIWNQGSLTFVKTSPGQFEAMTSQTHITRGSNQPLYNSVTESNANSDQCWNPGNTEWAEGNIASWYNLTYSSIGNVVGGCSFSNISNRAYVLHLISENIYLQITFTYWQQGGGNFTYTRTTSQGCLNASTANVSVCSNTLPYIWNGVAYTATGTYTKVLTNKAGCDSIAKLNLTILANPNTIISGSTNGCNNVQLQANTYLPGIKFEYYENWIQSALPDFNTLTPTTIGYTNKCSIDVTSRVSDNFAFRYIGKINIPTSGAYTFYTTSDDGSNLKIDGNLVVSNDFIQGPTERSGSVTLTAGYHDIEIGFYEHGGGEYMQANIQGPGISKVELSSNNYLVYQGASNYSWSTGATPNSSLNTISTSGLHSLTTTFSSGCSSTNNFTVTIGSSSNTNASVCQGSFPYTWNGLTFNTAGSQTAHLTNVTGCDSAATLNLSVVTSLPAITGASAACAGSSTTLSNAVAGGVWFTQATSQATINPSTGLVTAKNAGTITIKYSAAGCGSTTKSFTVNAIPGVPTIAYAPGTPNPQLGAPSGNFCVGKTFTVVGTPNSPAGLWTSTGIVGITSGGVVTIGAVGSGSLKYTYINANGCSNSRTMFGNGYTCASRGVNAVDGQVSNVNGFTMYPNPAHSLISINLNSLIGEGKIIVSDLYGKTVKAQPLSMGNNMVDIANLSKGMYFVSMITSEGKTTKKLVVE